METNTIHEAVKKNKNAGMKYFLFLLILWAPMAYAQEDVQSIKKTGAQLQAGAVVQIEGSRYASSALNPVVADRSYSTSSAHGLVKLSCPGAHSTATPLIGVAALNVSITYEVEVDGIFSTQTKTQLLKLEFTNGLAQDVAFVKLDGAQRVRVEILGAGNIFPAAWPDLELEVSVTTQSYEWMLPTVIASTTLTHQTALSADGNLNVNWTALSAAEYYELEWTYVSDQSANPAVRLTAQQVEVDRFLFRNNSSRVEVKGLSYAIPMIYEKGFILYRIRAVGRNIVNGVSVLTKSDWTTPDGLYSKVSEFPAANVYLFNGLEEKLNWQSSLSFAEEGKHKVVLSYHDGSSRNRQAVTRINSDKRAIVGETFYDYNGRPAIQTLPVPVTENNLTYYPRFNLVEGSSDMAKIAYDKRETGVTCSPLSPAFSTTTGASNYYSSDNTFSSTGGNTGSSLLNRDLIPDAEKFPYTQTYYAADNTGRIAAQSGVGAQYRIGTKKETRYLYGTPYQPELTRLFGTQVGYSGHYKKNTVIDPNGQTSVSYLDLDGKVVATALSGNAPENMDALPGNKQRTIKAEVLQADNFSNAMSADRLSKTYSSKFSVASPATSYKFDYSGQVGHYDLSCALSTSGNPLLFVMDGVVDVEWQLVNTCGEPVFVNVGSTNKGTTGTAQTVNLTETKLLPEGEYQLSKKISINEQKLDEYWQNYLTKEGICIRTQNSFEVEEYSKMNLLGCGLTCEQCATERDRLLADAIYTQEERASIATACDQLCDPSIGCRSSLEMLRGDMALGGQYGEIRKKKTNTNNSISQPTFDEDGNPIPPIVNTTVNNVTDEGIFNAGDPEDNKIVAEQFPMSLYNANNGLRFPPFLSDLSISKRANWRNPILITKDGFTQDNRANQVLFSNENLTTGVSYAVTSYTDRAGEILYVEVYKMITDPETNEYVYSPRVSDESKLILVDQEAGLYKVEVKYLAELKDFEKHWLPHWSNYLVVYHPEFEYLLDCTRDQDVLAFDYKLINSATILQAKANGMIDQAGDPLIIGATQANALDPYIKNSASNYAYIKNKYQNYLQSTVNNVTTVKDMAQTATMAAGCPQGTESCGVPGCLDGKIDTDEEWNIFKAMYLAEKQRLLKQKKNRVAVDNNYYNGCIGLKREGDIFSLSDANYFTQPHTYTESYISSYRPCYYNWSNPGHFNFGCIEPVVTTVERTTYPYLNPDQVCYVREMYKYKDKQQRFYVNTPASAGAGAMPEHCSTFVPSDVPGQPGDYISAPCADDIKAANTANAVEAQRYKYEQCGLCPMAQDLELLIIALKKENILISSTNKLLTCLIDDIDVTVGPTLLPALLQLNSNNPDIYWSSALSPDSKTLTGILSTNGQTLATLTLNIPTTATGVDFTNLKTPCCLTTNNSNGAVFTMQSSYIDPSTLKSVDFNLTGQFTLPLTPCFIPPRCLTTSDTKHVLFFMNTLVMGGSEFNYKRPNLNTNGAVLNLLDAGVTDASLKLNVPEFYTSSLRGMLNKDNPEVYNGYVENIVQFEPKWSSFIAGGMLSGSLSYVENSNTYTIAIEISGLPFPIENIKGFDNVRPLPLTPNATDVCNGSCEKKHFLADAIIMNGATKTYQTVDVYVPSLRPVVCQPAVPASN